MSFFNTVFFGIFRPSNTVGVFWNNAAETWVDINNSKDTNVMSSIVNLVSGHKTDTRIDAYFMSESGIFDLFVLMGPTPQDVVRQYATLTGTAPLPQVSFKVCFENKHANFIRNITRNWTYV